MEARAETPTTPIRARMGGRSAQSCSMAPRASSSERPRASARKGRTSRSSPTSVMLSLSRWTLMTRWVRVGSALALFAPSEDMYRRSSRVVSRPAPSSLRDQCRLGTSSRSRGSPRDDDDDFDDDDPSEAAGRATPRRGRARATSRDPATFAPRVGSASDIPAALPGSGRRAKVPRPSRPFGEGSASVAIRRRSLGKAKIRENCPSVVLGPAGRKGSESRAARHFHTRDAHIRRTISPTRAHAHTHRTPSTTRAQLERMALFAPPSTSSTPFTRAADFAIRPRSVTAGRTPSRRATTPSTTSRSPAATKSPPPTPPTSSTPRSRRPIADSSSPPSSPASAPRTSPSRPSPPDAAATSSSFAPTRTRTSRLTFDSPPRDASTRTTSPPRALTASSASSYPRSPPPRRSSPSPPTRRTPTTPTRRREPSRSTSPGSIPGTSASLANVPRRRSW